MIKHFKLGSVSETMNRIQALLQRLQSTVSHISIPADYSMSTATFATFADIVFDGIVADVYMQSKIMTSLDQVRKLRAQLEQVQAVLQELDTQ